MTKKATRQELLDLLFLVLPDSVEPFKARIGEILVDEGMLMPHPTSPEFHNEEVRARVSKNIQELQKRWP